MTAKVYYPDGKRMHRIKRLCQTCKFMQINEAMFGELTATCNSEKRKFYLNKEHNIATRPDMSCTKFWEIEPELAELIERSNQIIDKKNIGEKP